MVSINAQSGHTRHLVKNGSPWPLLHLLLVFFKHFLEQIIMKNYPYGVRPSAGIQNHDPFETSLLP